MKYQIDDTLSYEEWKLLVRKDIDWDTYLKGEHWRWQIDVDGRKANIYDSGHGASHCSYGFIQEILERLDFSNLGDEDYLENTVTFPYYIGYCECVETDDSDDIVFLTRENRLGPTRFVKNREASLCNTVFVILRRKGTDLYQLVTAYVGVKSGREPWDRCATEEDKAFWQTHALILPSDYEI